MSSPIRLPLAEGWYRPATRFVVFRHRFLPEIACLGEKYHEEPASYHLSSKPDQVTSTQDSSFLMI